MTSLVVEFSYQIELNISKSKTVKKFYRRSYIMILTDLSDTVKKLWEKISFHKNFKPVNGVKIGRGACRTSEQSFCSQYLPFCALAYSKHVSINSTSLATKATHFARTNSDLKNKTHERKKIKILK